MGDGMCYAQAGQEILDRGLLGGAEDAVLVHGVVVGHGPIEGLHYGHAWLEEGDWVCTWVGDKPIRVHRAVFYAVGRVQTTRSYTFEEARSEVLRHEHWGPWDPEIAAAYLDEREG